MQKTLAFLTGGGAVLATTFAAGPARSSAYVDAAFVDLLTLSGGRRHALADASGKLPVIVELANGADARSFGLLPLGAGLGTLRLLPAEVRTFEANHPGARLSIWPRLRPMLDQSAKLNGTVAYRQMLANARSPLTGRGKGVVVGVIDTGLDARHKDFLDPSGKSRVAWLLDMSAGPLGKHQDLEQQFGCTDPMQTPCAVLAGADIDDALATGGDLPSDPIGHGTHVASIAAGNGGRASLFVGGAPDATLVVAGVTRGSLEDVADADIATGARFIFDRAETLGMPAVINLSLGGDFGPHDGTTPLEKALASMVGPDHPGRAIVVAAGNSGAIYAGSSPEQTLGIHTEMRISHELPARLPVLSPGLAGHGEVSGTVFIWATFENSIDDIRVGLEGPAGLSIPSVARGEKRGYANGDNSFKAVVYNGVDQDGQPLAPDTHGAIIAWDGAFPQGAEMTLTFEGEGFVDAWMQSAVGNGSDEAAFEVATRQTTISVPATHPDLISVGCSVNRTTWTDQGGTSHDLAAIEGFDILSPVDSACYFSSAGPTATGAMKPEISAPGAMVAAAMSAAAAPEDGTTSIFDPPDGLCDPGAHCQVVDPEHAILTGSSMSAPQVAGAVALLFERNASLTQPEIRDLLEEGARRPAGKVPADYQLGVGVLDVAGAAAAEQARAVPIERAPDAERSWMTLSQGYAHPDARYPVVGNVLVRASDGSIADGFEPSRLQLRVDGGAVTAPLARVGPGFYRFAVVGAGQSGTDAIGLDVELDGVAVGEPGTRLSGHRVLGVGADRWIATGTARAFGGCALAAVGTDRPVAAWLALLLAVAPFMARRHRAPRRGSAA